MPGGVLDAGGGGPHCITQQIPAGRARPTLEPAGRPARPDAEQAPTRHIVVAGTQARDSAPSLDVEDAMIERRGLPRC